ncbi:hypothetical protein GCM10022252_74860 [Streptosporangium oxazolinicum]|uniref:Uncharacterized protein n=1 Tax=Streptosporangium oxazolinicum TaxID=909287 RepID=A0ABP8BKG4_9ACTN
MSLISDGTMPCPVPSPNGLPCSKTIPSGWAAEEGHGGGHFWVGPELDAIFAGGHYDARAALAGQPFEGHLPENCFPGCPYIPLVGRP